MLNRTKIIEFIRHHKLSLVVFICFLLLLFTADNWQQQQFAKADQAYHLMNENNYAEAAALFEEYLSTDSSIYWHGIQFVNGSTSIFTQANAENALLQCRQMIEKH